MKIAIIGSRDLPESWVLPKLNFLVEEKNKGNTIISGGARGVDKFVAMFCRSFKIPIEIIKPINPENKLDYLFRNVEIITKADEIVALWDGKSKGTKFVIDYATARNKKIKVITK